MRQLPNRGSLSAVTVTKLNSETVLIGAAADPKAEADTRYAAARKAAWFRPVTRALAILSGVGQRCMYCSGSESAQVEHYRPKATYPTLALEWDNLLWICGICNQAKGDRFDPATPPINPTGENAWDYFFIDQFGNLSPKWNIAINDIDPRAKRTIELCNLDRQALQECRQERLNDLRNKVEDSLLLLNAGSLTLAELEVRVLTWLDQPFQPEIADYFIAGPGAADSSEPFQALIATLEA